MNRSLYLRQWLLAMDRFELRLRGKAGRERNTFIRAAARSYEKHGGGISHFLRAGHQNRVRDILNEHYTAVMPYFGALAVKPVKSRRGRIEKKANRQSFLSHATEWAQTRALAAATSISDTDYNDVQDVITSGLEDGLGVEEIASNIRGITDLTPFRAATLARTETHAAATYGAIEEARQASDEIGITLQKEWLPTLDDRTRPAHAEMANTDPIPLDDLFDVGGEQMDRPGDPSASAENTINCRCALVVPEAS